ncbi:MAG: hypothetical protein J6L05_02540 [Ruminococcus sp.]|nr:hypothetical protein [Ruminococcus sp.]
MEIYAKGKNIPTYAFGNLLTQGEHLADTICFIVDRFYNNTDLSVCDFAIRGLTAGDWEVSQPLIAEVIGEKIRLKWTVGNSFTINSGRLALEIRASQYSEDEEKLIVKYVMQPVYVNPTPNGKNGALPETSEQAVSAINAAVAEGTEQLGQLMDSFNLEEVEKRLDKMEADTAVYLARPEVIALTKSEYDSTFHKSDSLYVIVGED